MARAVLSMWSTLRSPRRRVKSSALDDEQRSRSWQAVGMSVVRTSRDRARAEVVAAIKQTAAGHLATSGAAGLSLRAVARDLGLVSSALYRYFPSRDALLTALIVDAYDAVGEVAEGAEATSSGGPAGARWLAVCRAVRAWARAHPHDYALVYGSPVPGYAAPTDTVAAAQRISLVMARIVLAGAADGSVRPPTRPLTGRRLATDEAVRLIGGVPDAPHERLVERSLVLLTALFGALSYELFGHLLGAVDDPDAWFDLAVAVAAEGVGLDVPLG